MAATEDNSAASAPRALAALRAALARPWYARWLNPGPQQAALQDCLRLLPEIAAQQGALQADVQRHEKILADFNRTLLLHTEAHAAGARLRASLGLLSAQVSALAAHAAALQSRVDALATGPDSLPQTREQLRQQAAELAALQRQLLPLLNDLGPEQDELFARFYLAFENEFRGAPEEIARRQQIYLPRVTAALQQTGRKQWMDLGCGRGEWLAMLKTRSADPIGVDNNPAMLATCRERGLAVQDADALAALQAVPAGTLAGVSAFHLIEHLPYRTMLALIHAAHAALAPGGCLILETPNPQNVSVGACNFYMDLTHRNPIPPMTTEFMARHFGFANVEILRLHPTERHAERDSLPTVTEREFCELFYGPRDYALVASK